MCTLYNSKLLECSFISQVNQYIIGFVCDFYLDVHLGLGGDFRFCGLVGLIRLQGLGFEALIMAQVVDGLLVLLDRKDISKSVFADSEEDFAPSFGNRVIA